MADYPRLLFGAAIVLLALGVLTILAMVAVPALFGGGGSSLLIYLPVAAMLLIVLSGVVGLIGTLFILYEIATAKNDGQWKAVWIIVILVLGIIGMALYFALARKGRKGASL